MNRKPTIAFLLAELSGNYQQSLIKNLREALTQRGWGSVWYLGWPLVVPTRVLKPDNSVLDLLCQARPSGILTANGVMANFISEKGYQRIATELPNVPLVSFSTPVHGRTSVLVNNRSGVADAVRHLIDAHGCQRIGFLRGVPGNGEALARYEGFREGLASRGRAPDPQWVFDGFFSTSEAELAIVKFLERRLPLFDALVCSNDDMAVGAAQALTKWGIRIPEDVKLTGFDDLEATAARVPLTSVRQPFEDLIRQSVAALAEEMADPSLAPREFQLSATLMERRSCGCFPEPESLPPLPEGLIDGLTRDFERALADSEAFAKERLMQDWETLSSGLLEGPRPTANLVTVFMQMQNRVADERGLRLLHQLICLGSERIDHSRGRRRKAEERQRTALHTCVVGILTSYDWDELFSILTAALPSLGLKTFYVTLFERPFIEEENGVSVLPDSWLALAVENSTFIPRGGEGTLFRSGDLVPPSVLDLWGEHGRTFLFLPLFFRQEQFGGLVVEYLVPSETLYEALRSALSNAIKVISSHSGPWKG